MSRGRFYIFGFGVLVLFDTLVQVSLKLAAARVGEFVLTAAYFRDVVLTPWIYVAIGGYLGAFISWMTLLKHAAIGPAFAASHLEVVTVLIVSFLLFGERLAGLQIVGALCIVFGILCLSMSKARHLQT